MKVRSSGGPAQTIVAVTLSARGASWGSKNIIVYSRTAGGPLWSVNADGSGASVLTGRVLTPDERSHRWPMFLPDGDRFLFWAGNFSKEGARSGIYLSSLSKRQKTFLLEARSTGMLTAVSTTAGSTFSTGPRQPLFRVRPRPPISNTDLFSYDVSKDGSRFIVNRYVKPPSVPPLNIVLNATAAAAESRD